MTSENWNPVIFGHRGARGLAPENTIPGFQCAADLGLPAVELDVHLTKDDVPVVIHDHKVDRTTDGSGRIKTFTLDEIQSLDAANEWVPRFRGTVIPTLDEVISKYGDRFHWQIEFKVDDQSPDVPGLVRKCAALVEKRGLSGYVTFTSFTPSALEFAREAAPTVERGLLCGTNPDAAVETAIGLGCGRINMNPTLLELQVVEAVRTAGLTLGGWAGNGEEALKMFCRAKADRFTTDWPDRAIKWMTQQGLTPSLTT